MNNVAWWHNITQTPLTKVILLQLDLSGHSKWLLDEFQLDYRGVQKERAHLADGFVRELRARNFHCVFWAGDGGLFAHEQTDPGQVCDAADEAFEYFEKWRNQHESRKAIGLRVTGTIMDIVLDPDPSHWCAPELNDFLKYEREIGRHKAFVITQPLRAYLGGTNCQKRFPQQMAYQVSLPNGPVLTVYLDKDHPGPASQTASTYKVQEGEQTFSVAKKGRILNPMDVYPTLLRADGLQRQKVAVLWPDLEATILERGADDFWNKVRWTPKEGLEGRICGKMKHFSSSEELYLMEFPVGQERIYTCIRATGVEEL